MKRHNFDGNKKLRQETAQKNTEARSKLSHQEQLKRLDAVFGVGLGATKERARLNKLLQG